MKPYRILSGFAAPAAGAAGGLGTFGSIAGLGLSLVGQMMNFQAQSAAAEAQAEMQRRAEEQRIQALRLEQQGLRQRQMEEQEKIAREQFAASLQNKQQKAQAEAAAASAGVTGPSVDALVNEFDFRLGMFNEASLRQKQILDRSTTLDLKGAGQQFTSDMVRIQQPIARPSAFGLALGIGSTLLDSKLFDKK